MNPKELHAAHMKRLHDTAKKDLGRFQREKTAAEKEREAVSDAHSKAWNKSFNEKLKAAAKQTEPERPDLPPNWRDEHWKTLQKWADDFAGVEASNKVEAIAALEEWETAQLREMI
ncbi:hypothetical protein [Roseibium sediminis]|uniref:hypothetical protein n=1 Tax=Roseibium sediminis TaxID=1775174 RepID=UPI00123C998A|nr:hypothetical protein [Roseibium sediminis]